jgi:hypothetical protein
MGDIMDENFRELHEEHNSVMKKLWRRFLSLLVANIYFLSPEFAIIYVKVLFDI